MHLSKPAFIATFLMACISNGLSANTTITLKYAHPPGEATIYIAPSPVSASLYAYSSQTAQQKVTVRNGIYQFHTSDISSLHYFSVTDSNGFDKRINNLMVMPDDSLIIEVDTKTITVSGRGSSKNNVLRKLEAIIADSAYSQLSAFEAQVLNINAAYVQKLKLLATFKDQIEAEVYEAIKAAIQYRTYYLLANHYRFNLIVQPSAYSEIKACYLKYGLPAGIDAVSTPVSIHLYEYLILRQFVAYQINQPPGTDRQDNIPAIYDLLKKAYTKPLSDQLLVHFLSNRYKSFSTDSLFKDALAYVTTADLRQSLLAMKQKFGSGSPAYDFKLQDTSGKYVSLSALRGKVLVIDFWIEPCAPCIKLAQDLKQVSNRLRNEKDVLFVSISAEKNKESWKRVIKAGKHTFDGQLMLYTNGLGSEHPLISHYGYNGFPQILLVDKAGNVISSRPERPSDEGKADMFIKMIQQHL
ncbi:TlpA family protein disulfide reductase [Chitinophaga pendula]|uniref:TlpA family protein disulfide reductase n=1 Tax=Chitinophaga TaxID=79328 RepID=UPI000BAFA544|nr:MULTISPECIES: TlpA disulfide reductase family protein [Chitinophaga]ASZ13443.1 hypothetical protein CK934_22025 [Chitinophaga sp. MD30]UCJ08931.1 TlpA family protein disulfide reductase [Chitinophaga pendula]